MSILYLRYNRYNLDTSLVTLFMALFTPYACCAFTPVKLVCVIEQNNQHRFQYWCLIAQKYNVENSQNKEKPWNE